mgnify:CR=1 FL=1
MRELTEQEIVRREKAEKIKELGLTLFFTSFVNDAFVSVLPPRSRVQKIDFRGLL